MSCTITSGPEQSSLFIKEVRLARDDNGDHTITVELSETISDSSTTLDVTFFPSDPANILIGDRNDTQLKYQLYSVSETFEYQVFASKTERKTQRQLGQVKVVLGYLLEYSSQILSLIMTGLSALNASSVIHSKLAISMVNSLGFLNFKLDTLAGEFIQESANSLRNQKYLILWN